MNLFYNKEGVGDVAFLQIEPTDGPFEYEIKNNVVAIKHENQIVGFNIFDFSKVYSVNSKGHIKLNETLVEAIQQSITNAGFDYQLEADLSPKFVVGYVETKEKHPDADKLSILKVDVGSEKLQIVCGAPNVEAGQKVVVAKVGELRGVASSGMICSMRELNLPNAPQEKGIMVLSDDYKVGNAFFD